MYKNINTKGKIQCCGTKSYLTLMLSKLKIMEGFIFIYTPLSTYLKETSMGVSMCSLIKETF